MSAMKHTVYPVIDLEHFFFVHLQYVIDYVCVFMTLFSER